MFLLMLAFYLIGMRSVATLEELKNYCSSDRVIKWSSKYEGGPKFETSLGECLNGHVLGILRSTSYLISDGFGQVGDRVRKD